MGRRAAGSRRRWWRRKSARRAPAVRVPLSVPTPDHASSTGRGWGLAPLVAGLTAALGALAGWAIDRRWLGGRGAEDDSDDEDDGGLVLPAGTEHVVATDDGAELVATVITPDGARRGRFRRGRSRPATVVLAHGWTNTRAVWAPVARRLVAAGHPVIAYDQRGHGGSSLGDAPPTIQRLGDDLATVLDHFDVRGAVLAGHSMGGFTIMSFAIDHPDELHRRVRALVLVATAAHGVGFGSLNRLASQIVGGRALSWAMARPRLGLALVRGASGRSPRRRDLLVTRDLFVGTRPEVRAAAYLACTAMDLRAGLPAIDVPTVVLAGSRDSVTPARLGRTIADTIPGARFELLPGAGHMLLLEERDRVAGAILRLADGADGEPESDGDAAADADEVPVEVPAPSGAD
jgi:pimeloyl-ACP methyl ester carboxylesterase